MLLKRYWRQLPSGCRSCCQWLMCIISVFLVVFLVHFRSFHGFETPLQWAPHSKISTKVEDFVEKEVRVEAKPPYSCRIPKIDPFDPSILYFVEHPRNVTCEPVQLDLVYLDEEGRLTVNKTAMRGGKKGKITCWYQYFDRGDTDFQIVYGTKNRLEKPVKMKKLFAKAACDQGPNSTRIFVNFFANPAVPPNPSDPPHRPLSPRGTDINVLIFCLESASSSMAHRHLPKTLDFLNRTGAIIFKNFLKVGENTLPNVAAMLTGKRTRKEQDDMPAELPEPEDGFYDQWPIIWKKYRQKGYETMYLEDSPHIGTFHYSGKGFKKKPVDRWYFPFWYSQRQKWELFSASSRFCYGNEPVHKIFTDIVRGELTRAKAQNRRQFVFSMINELTHDYTFDLERADDTWFDMFRRLDSKRALNRTIVIVVADHGPRFAKHRTTPVGFAEERLPFLAIRMPPFLYSRYPRLREILETNAASRLVSMFDLHETLLDVLNRVYDGEPPEETSIRGRSLFKPLPSDRTCHQAGIPDRYCLCDGFQVTPKDHVAARPAAMAVLAEVNRKVKKHKKKCATWKFHKIIYFIRVPWPGEVVGRTKTYFVAFKAKPLGGEFEGVVVRNMTNDSVKFKRGTLKRLNPSGFGDCLLSEANLWSYCACRKYLSA